MPWGRILSSHGILIVRPLWVYLPALKWHQVPSSGHETKRHPGDRWDGGENFLRAVSGDTLNTPNICLKVNWWDLISKWCLMIVIPEIKLSIHGVHVYIFNACVVSLVIILFLDWWIYIYILIHQSSPIRKLIGVECICWFNFVYSERHLGSARRCLPKIPRDLRVDNSMFLRKLRPCNSGNPNVFQIIGVSWRGISQLNAHLYRIFWGWPVIASYFSSGFIRRFFPKGAKNIRTIKPQTELL